MKFIHAADAHLDSPFGGLNNDYIPKNVWDAILGSTFKSFENMVDLAIQKNVDFILLAGDIFDRNEQSVAAEVFLNTQLNRLNDHDILVYMGFGNHDFGKTIVVDTYPNNTFVFNNEVTTTSLVLKNQQAVQISGYSFPTKWVTDRIIGDYPANNHQADFYIGMLHGSAEGINSVEGNYAPFSLNELQSKNYDYWALGHIHKRQSLDSNDVINYPGNLQGRNINENGPKGFLLVEENNQKLTTEFVETAPIVWDTVAFDFEYKSLDQTIKEIFSKLDSLNYNKLHLVKIELKGSYVKELLDLSNNGELLKHLQIENSKCYEQINAWISSVTYIPMVKQKFTNLDQMYLDEAQKQVVTKTKISEFGNEFSDYQFIEVALNEETVQNNIKRLAINNLEENLIDREDIDSDY